MPGVGEYKTRKGNQPAAFGLFLAPGTHHFGGRQFPKKVSKMNAIAVPFHGNTLFVVDHEGHPYTPMKPIAEGMGLDWRSQATKFRSNKARWGVVEITTPSSGGEQSSICLPLRKLMGWMMTIYPNKVKPEIRDSIIRYQNECDDALWDYWTKGQATRQMAPPVLKSPTLTASEQQTLSEIVDRRARECANIGKAKAEIWSRIHRKFRVAKYNQLAREQLSDAIAYVMQMDIKTEALPEMALPERTADTDNPNYAYAKQQLSSLYDWGKQALTQPVQEEFWCILKQLDRSLIKGWTEMDEALIHLTIAASMLNRWKRAH